MTPEKRNKIIIFSILAIAVVFIGVKLLQPPAPETTVNPALQPTKAPVPKNVVVPEVGSKVSSDVAVPKETQPAAPGSDSKLRVFEIKAVGNQFDPSEIRVNLGDLVNIKFTAVDKDYDITVPDYGLKQTAKKGETKPIGFQANSAGQFTYYCGICGGLNSTAKGFIIVKP